MRERILQTLQAIEDTHGVRIVYACESGSRAWGFASLDSDWDVRFIYIHPFDWYVSIDEGKDVIEIPINDLLDVNGWDLRKALRLLRKSNPVLMEWLNSPIVYREHPSTMSDFRALSSRLYSPLASFHHYLQMARGNFREYLRGDTVWLKKYLYVLRPTLACLWIERNTGMPPVRFSELVDTLVEDQALRNSITALLASKMSGDELRAGSRDPIIHAFIEAQLCRPVPANLPKPQNDSDDLEAVNAFFRRAIGCLL